MTIIKMRTYRWFAQSTKIGGDSMSKFEILSIMLMYLTLAVTIIALFQKKEIDSKIPICICTTDRYK